MRNQHNIPDLSRLIKKSECVTGNFSGKEQSMTQTRQLMILFILLGVLAMAIVLWQTHMLHLLVLPMPMTEGS